MMIKYIWFPIIFLENLCELSMCYWAFGPTILCLQNWINLSSLSFLAFNYPLSNFSVGISMMLSTSYFFVCPKDYSRSCLSRFDCTCLNLTKVRDHTLFIFNSETPSDMGVNPIMALVMSLLMVFLFCVVSVSE